MYDLVRISKKIQGSLIHKNHVSRNHPHHHHPTLSSRHGGWSVRVKHPPVNLNVMGSNRIWNSWLHLLSRCVAQGVHFVTIHRVDRVSQRHVLKIK